jgi:hypothetical protein
MNSANCAELPRETAAGGPGPAAVSPIQRHIPQIERSAKSEHGCADDAAGGKLRGAGDGFTCCLLPNWFDVDKGDY